MARLFEFDFVQKQITTSYLVQASVSPPPPAKTLPTASWPEMKAAGFIQLRAGSPVLLQRSSLSAGVYSSPLIRLLFAFSFFSRVHNSELTAPTAFLRAQILLHGRSEGSCYKMSFLPSIASAAGKQSLAVRQTALLGGLCVVFLLRTK